MEVRQLIFNLSHLPEMLNLVSNPYAATIKYSSTGSECRILGSSGQCTDDILRNTRIEGPLHALHYSLRWQHMAPTAPDTLSTRPLFTLLFSLSDTWPSEFDSFVIEELPN